MLFPSRIPDERCVVPQVILRVFRWSVFRTRTSTHRRIVERIDHRPALGRERDVGVGSRRLALVDPEIVRALSSERTAIFLGRDDFESERRQRRLIKATTGGEISDEQANVIKDRPIGYLRLGHSIHSTVRFRLLELIHVVAFVRNRIRNACLRPAWNHTQRLRFPETEVIIHAGRRRMIIPGAV